MRLLIMGPPGAGKGTQAGLVAAHYQIPAISTGDIFRAMQTADTPLAAQVRAIMASGGYVSDEITNSIVADRLGQADCEQGFLLDGYPRTVAQVQTLDDALAADGHHLHAVIALVADVQTLDDALAADGHHLHAVIALVADVDEVVARLLLRARTEGRVDDNEETIRVRQQVYAEQTAPLLDAYRERGLLVEVDGLGPVPEVAERLFAALDEHQPPVGARPAG